MAWRPREHAKVRNRLCLELELELPRQSIYFGDLSKF
jgi:hypothetical protein